MTPQYLMDVEPLRPRLTEVESFALAILRGRKGQARAMRKVELAQHVGLGTRATRRVIKALIESHGYPICSAYRGDAGGYFWPVTDAEIAAARRRLYGHALSMLVRARALGQISRRMQNVIEQLRLEIQA